MATIDLYSNIIFLPSLDIGLVPDGTGTVEGDGIDTYDFESVVMVVAAVRNLDATQIIRIQDSPDNINFEDVDPQFLQGAAIITSAIPTNTYIPVGYLGINRYVRAINIYIDSEGDDIAGAFFALSSPRMGPVNG